MATKQQCVEVLNEKFPGASMMDATHHTHPFVRLCAAPGRTWAGGSSFRAMVVSGCASDAELWDKVLEKISELDVLDYEMED